MENQLPDWLKEALKRIEDENVKVLIDTPDKAKEYGIMLGETIIIRNPRKDIRTAQQGLDEFKAREYLRDQCIGK